MGLRRCLHDANILVEHAQSVLHRLLRLSASSRAHAKLSALVTSGEEERAVLAQQRRVH